MSRRLGGHFSMMAVRFHPLAWQGIWTKIEATELYRLMLLENLNTHDQDHYMRFELAEPDYDYRIVFSTGQGTTQFHVRTQRHK
jgi:hypothetical protein